MSNIIKWNYINFDPKEKHMVNSDQSDKVKENILNGASLDSILNFHLNTPQDLVDSLLKKESNESDFVAGMNVIDYDKERKQDRERISLEAESILSNARIEAQNLLDEAASQLELLKQQAYEEGRQEGYDAGILEGSVLISSKEEELLSKEQQLNERENLQEEIFADRQRQMEPYFADILMQLLEKLTGVLAEDKKDIILHLVKTGIKDAGHSKQFTIHVCIEDAELVREKKEQILSELANECELEIVIDETLSKNQCMIETDNKLLDASLDIQLKNLIEDLKLLSISG